MRINLARALIVRKTLTNKCMCVGNQAVLLLTDTKCVILTCHTFSEKVRGISYVLNTNEVEVLDTEGQNFSCWVWRSVFRVRRQISFPM